MTTVKQSCKHEDRGCIQRSFDVLVGRNQTGNEKQNIFVFQCFGSCRTIWEIFLDDYLRKNRPDKQMNTINETH